MLVSEILITREEVGGVTTMTIVTEVVTTVAPGGVRTEAEGEATDTTMEGRARGAGDRAGYAYVGKG